MKRKEISIYIVGGCNNQSEEKEAYMRFKIKQRWRNWIKFNFYFYKPIKKFINIINRSCRKVSNNTISYRKVK